MDWIQRLFAIGPILKWSGLPGIVGLGAIFWGFTQQLTWLAVTGLVLAAPVLWCVGVIVLVYLPVLAWDRFRPSRASAGKSTSGQAPRP